MSKTILQFEKQQTPLRTFTLYDIPITKQGIESAILKISGLSSDQYEVAYLDSQNDRIMAAVDEDYLIAEQTLEDDTIVFQVEVKIDPSLVKFVEDQDDDQISQFQSQDEQTEKIEGDKAEEIHNSIHSSNRKIQEQSVPKQLQTKNQKIEEPLSTQHEKQMVDSIGQEIIVDVKSPGIVNSDGSKADKKPAMSELEIQEQQFIKQEAVFVPQATQEQMIKTEEIKSKATFSIATQTEIQEKQSKAIQTDFIHEIQKVEPKPQKPTQPKLVDINQLLQNEQFLQSLLAKLTDRLPLVLNPQCFKNTSGPKMEWTVKGGAREKSSFDRY